MSAAAAGQSSSPVAMSSAGLCDCLSRGCRVRFVGNGHRHCCGECKRTYGARHSRRCLRQQRLDRLETLEHSVASNTSFFSCATLGCNRVTSGTFLFCCSTCDGTGGMQHTVRCQHRRRDSIPATSLAPSASLGPSGTQTAATIPAAAPGVTTGAGATWMDVVPESEQGNIEQPMTDPVTFFQDVTGGSPSETQQSQSVQNCLPTMVDLEALD